MSFFNAVYGDQELSSRAKMVCLYLHDRARPASIRMDRKAAQIPGKWGMYLQSVPDTEVRTAQTAQCSAKGTLRRFCGLGVGSAWTGQKGT